MSVFNWVAFAGLAVLLLAIGGSILFPPGIGRNDGRCGEDARVSRTRVSPIRSAWVD